MSKTNPALPVEQQALKLAQANKKSEPHIKKFLWFPNDNEIRLVEIEDDIPKTTGKQIQPYYFGPSPQDNLFVRSAIALIRSDEYGVLSTPKGWGGWDAARELTVG